MKATFVLLALAVCLQFATVIIIFNNSLDKTRLPCSSMIDSRCEVYKP